jgi:pyruvate dehydrogenase (quinone)
MTQKTVAEIFIETLIAAGVTRIYGVVGDSLNGILEEVRRSKKISACSPCSRQSKRYDNQDY